MKKGNRVIMLYLSLFIFIPFINAHAADAVAGRAKFDTLCATCHGPSGKGDGPAATSLNPKPTNLGATQKADVQLKQIISGGGAANGLSPMMPPFTGQLSDADINNVIAHIRTLK